MHPVTEMLLKQADAIDGYSRRQLLDDLLASEVHLMNVKLASEKTGLATATLHCWMSRGRIKRYGTAQRGRRVDYNEIMRIMMKGESDGTSQNRLA